MRVLFVAYRHDPRNPDLGSGSEFNFLNAIRASGFDVKVLGPFNDKDLLIERVVRRLYKRYTTKRYLKFPLYRAWRISQFLNRSITSLDPDVVFTLFPPPLVFYTGSVPCIYRLDTTFLGQEEEWPLYGKSALAISVWQEKRAFRKSTKIVTHSGWSRDVLINRYRVSQSRICVFHNPSALPDNVVPDSIEIERNKHLEFPLRLLLVGRDFNRKGVDIAITVVRLLNERNVPARLTVCGTRGENRPYVEFVGPYKKTDENELKNYVELYQRAHLLLHPAFFEAAGIVPSEAAAFGTPTIANSTGGLTTTVKNGVSGIVLPKGSGPEAYVRAIVDLVSNPIQYHELCTRTRKRYENELNWKVAGKRLAQIVRDAVGGQLK